MNKRIISLILAFLMLSTFLFTGCDALMGGEETNLEEVGQEFKITRERIRQIEAKALRKLRHPSRARHLKGFME